MFTRSRFLTRWLIRSGANPRNLWIGYILGFTIFAAIISAAFITTRYNIALLDKYAKASLIASQQSSISRMVSEMAEGKVGAGQISSSKIIERAISEYLRNHEKMLSIMEVSTPLESFFLQNANEMIADMKKIKLDFESFAAKYTDGSQLVRTDETKVFQSTLLAEFTALDDQIGPTLTEGRQLNVRHANLEKALNLAEGKSVEYGQIINNWLYGMALFLMLMEAILIFWPAHLISSFYYLRSGKQKRKMNELLKNMSAQNQKIRAAYAQIGHDALHDTLTGLANRRYFKEELQRLVENRTSDRDQLAVLHIDLDRFNQVNDSMGHKAGDHVLKRVSDRIKQVLKGTGFAARIGGDEFVILSVKASDISNLEKLSDSIVQALSSPILFEGQRCDVSASVGADLVYIRPFSGELEVSEVLASADLALYQAKQAGGCCFRIYHDGMLESQRQQINLRDEISMAITRHEFIPYYQLQFDALTHEIVSAEALVRWRHPTRGILQPSEFLDEVISMGFGAKLDKMIMKAALSDLSVWRLNKDCPVKNIAINLGVDSIGDPNFISTISQLNIPKGSLSFEITETVDVNRDSTQVIQNVETLKDLGFEIEIDDFGTGHASILSLQYLKPKRLKIDREFIFPIADNPDQRNLVKSIIDLSKPFDISVVAEGVETMQHAKILADLGCDILQGYALCVPIPAVGVTAMLAKRNDKVSFDQRNFKLIA